MKFDKRKVYLTKKKKSNNGIYIKDICYEVNKFDKSFGVRLKHPEIFYTDKAYTKEMLKYANSILSTLFARINNIDPKSICITDPDDEEYGSMQDSDNISYLLSKYSILGWDDDIPYNISDIRFKMRFMSCIILLMIDNIGKICKNVIHKGKGYYKHSIDEQVFMLIPEVIKLVSSCVNLMIYNKPYKNTLIQIILYLSYSKKKIKNHKLQDFINYELQPMYDSVKPRISIVNYSEDDVVIHSLLCTAYVFATNLTNHYKVIPEYTNIEGATFKHDLSKLISVLGEAILDKKLSDVFDAFLSSSPIVKTGFTPECIKDRNLVMGLYSLEFVKFIFNDKTITRLIEEMKKKGI